MNTNKTDCSTGIFIISLDFELYWGMRELASLKDEDFRQQLLGVYQAVPAILELFKQYNIHATWAVVGFLYFQDAHKLRSNLPSELPEYKNRALSPYREIECSDPSDNKFQFCPKLIELIQQYSGQEIGTHTFSHYYCLEDGQTQAEFQADLQAAIKTANQANLETKSLVFPRNQYNEDYLTAIAELGLTSYRGNETHWLYDWDGGKGNNLGRRLLRLTDSYLPISGRHCYSMEQLKTQYPINIPASRFLRPYSAKLKPLDPLKLKRITSCLNYAAQEGLVYHLWWHPHNFGTNLEQNLEFLAQILEYYQDLNHKYDLQSLSMGEVAKLCL